MMMVIIYLQEQRMPRVSQQQTDQNRIAIENASATLFREHGLNGVSVADLMSAAGLTHGGFYGHFSSKDGLAAVACTRAFEGAAARWDRRFESLPDATARRAAYVDGYLAATSRDRPGSGCAVAALAGDVAREAADKPVRSAYLHGVKAMQARLAALQAPGVAADAAQRQALVDMATLVGALLLSRATRGDAISDAILASAHEALLRSTEPGAGT